MRLPSSKVHQLASEMLNALIADEGIEVTSPREVQLDIESVLRQYIRDEAELTEKAKDLLAAQRRPPTDLARVKRQVADQRGFKVGDDALDYLLDQLVGMLMHTRNVEEIYIEDAELRRRMRDPLRRQLQSEEQLEREVRGRLRHVAGQEGGSTWEVEYRRMMDDIRRRKGL